jgi:hypothetical protein
MLAVFLPARSAKSVLFSSTHPHLYMYLAPVGVPFLTFFAYRQELAELDHLLAVVSRKRTPPERRLPLRRRWYTRYGQLWTVICLRDVQETEN